MVKASLIFKLILLKKLLKKWESAISGCKNSLIIMLFFTDNILNQMRRQINFKLTNKCECQKKSSEFWSLAFYMNVLHKSVLETS